MERRKALIVAGFLAATVTSAVLLFGAYAANAAARRFYARHDFVLRKEFTLYGRAMCLYQLTLDAPTSKTPTPERPRTLLHEDGRD